VMSHDALARSGGGHKTVPNAWFVGMTPRRNPDIVVTVLWENGDWGANSAKLGAQVVDAFVSKQRKAAGNLHIAEEPKPAESPQIVTSTAAPGQ
jgi:penicillin-binding protein 2